VYGLSKLETQQDRAHENERMFNVLRKEDEHMEHECPYPDTKQTSEHHTQPTRTHGSSMLETTRSHKDKTIVSELCNKTKNTQTEVAEP